VTANWRGCEGIGCGITAYLEAGGRLKNAQAMAAHESQRTTKLYDRTGDEMLVCWCLSTRVAASSLVSAAEGAISTHLFAIEWSVNPHFAGRIAILKTGSG
jgi:hypothetical protein